MSEHIAHDVNYGISEVERFMLEKGNEAGKVCMEYFGYLLA